MGHSQHPYLSRLFHCLDGTFLSLRWVSQRSGPYQNSIFVPLRRRAEYMISFIFRVVSTMHVDNVNEVLWVFSFFRTGVDSSPTYLTYRTTSSPPPHAPSYLSLRLRITMMPNEDPSATSKLASASSPLTNWAILYLGGKACLLRSAYCLHEYIQLCPTSMV